MPSLLSKFTKNANGLQKQDGEQVNVSHRRAASSVESSAASSWSNPRLILTSDSSESLTRNPPSPDSVHRPQSLAHDAHNRGNSLHLDDEETQIRKSFSDRMREGNRRVSSLGTQPETAELEDPFPGLRRPTRALPEEPSSETTLTTNASHERSRSQNPVATHSRHNSTASIEQQILPMESAPTQFGFSQQGVIASPTSEDGHSSMSPSSPPSKDKKGWGRQGSMSSQKSTKSKRKVHPSGGLAGALAGSGLALANPAMQRRIVPPVPPPIPRPQTSPSELSHRPARKDRHSHSANSRKSSHNLSLGQEGAIEDDTIIQESGSEESEDDSSPDDLDLSEAAPITGFAVASNKRTADFHTLFPTVPEGDYLIDDYGCALQREILIQGRLYISENHICFHANIFGWTTDLVIPIEDITQVEKRMTAYVIPNAIQISTHAGKFTFASLLSRDTTYDVIYNIWRSVRPSIPNSPRSSIDGIGQNSVSNVMEGIAQTVNDKLVNNLTIPRKATMCACGREGKHYAESAMETIVPGEPEKIYNLMFASGFIKDFMRNDEKLMDIQISDWAPISEDSEMLTRNMSYIKPLSGGLGPKQTKCELKDDMLYLDYNDYITMLTTTRTPDVPSGNVFSVKTRTCLMWAGAASTRIVVTTQVEWTGRSFIRGIIERSCIDGQKVYHSNLERAIRAYITDHKSEFIPKDADGQVIEEAAAVLAQPASPTNAVEVRSSEDIRIAKGKERSQRGLQWALDTVEGTAKVAQHSFTGAIELIKDTWESSSTTAVLWFVVVGLVLSNIWTYFRAGRIEAAARRKFRRPDEDIQGMVGESVRDAFRVFEEVVRGDGKTIREEVADVKRALASIDVRVQKVEERMASLD